MPEMIYEYMLDMLTSTSVSVIKKTFIILEEGEPRQPVGKPVRTSYVNNALGRAAVLEELPDNFSAGILAVWGDTPTLPDPPSPVDDSENEEAR